MRRTMTPAGRGSAGSGLRRRTTGIVLLTVAAGLALTPSRSNAVESFQPGRGSARAIVLRAGPGQAGLEVAVDVAESLADFQVSVGRATATSVGSGVLGLVAPDVVAQLPAATRVSSSDEGSDGGTSTVFPDNPAGVGLTRQEASATDEPSARARTTFGSFGLPGLVSLSGARSQAVAGVVEGERREATGTVDIPAVELFDGMVQLEGLRWRATQRSGAAFPEDLEEEAWFSIGRITLAGQDFATPATPAQAAAALDQLNTALGVSGVQIVAPKVVRDGTKTVITPLVVAFGGGEVSRQVVAPALAAVQPARDELTAALFEQAPDAAAAVLVADLALGPFSGSGALAVEIGGAEASTDGRTFTNPFAVVPTGRSTPPSAGPVARAAGSSVARPAGSPVPPAAASPAVRPVPPDSGPLAAAPQRRSVEVGVTDPVRALDDGGGTGAVVAAACGLVVALALAGGEWARVRRNRFLFLGED